MKIVANFKMNLTPSETKSYLMNFIPRYKSSHDLTLCFPYTNLTLASFLVQGSSVKIGGQNICEDEDVKTTGEISGKMLKDCGVNKVIVGHIERRVKFKETNKMINKKIKTALKNGLGVVLCIGETLAEKNTLKTLDSLKTQIEECLKGLYEKELENIIIAYEPVWAIGTGATPLAKEIETSIKAIRKVISEDFSPKAGEEVNVIYGGSVNYKNIISFSKIKNLNGFLIGKSCLDGDNFLQILSSI